MKSTVSTVRSAITAGTVNSSDLQGEVIYEQNAGTRHAHPDVLTCLNACEIVDPKVVYLRTVAKFETSAEGLKLLACSTLISVGEHFPNEVIVRFHCVE